MITKLVELFGGKIRTRGRWFSIKREGNPEKPQFKGSYEIYLVQTKTVTIPYTAYWDGEKWEDETGNLLSDVIAYMELPQRYEGE